MIVIDEVDAIFSVQTNLADINAFVVNHMQVGLGLKPQYVLFSATMEQNVIDTIE